MSFAHLGVGLDLVVLFLMVFTIYYALKLSKTLNAFREDREHFEKVMRELNGNIERARIVLNDLRNAAEDPEGATRDLVSKNQDLLDDLQAMNAAGNALADRLERLAKEAPRHSAKASDVLIEKETSSNKATASEDPREALSKIDADADIFPYKRVKPKAITVDVVQTLRDQDDTSSRYTAADFSNYVRSGDERPSRPHVDTGTPSFAIQDRELSDDADTNFDEDIESLSQAERELYAALKNKG